MSTDYRPLRAIPSSDFFDGRLTACGIFEHWNAEGQRCLFDSMNYIQVYEDEDCMVTGFTRWGGNNPTYILESVTEAFDVRIVSEYEPEYHGFDTQEEWDAFEDALARKFADEFYADLIRYAKGEPNDIHPGTIGHTQAEMARALIAKEPALGNPAMRETLMSRLNARYETEHVVRVRMDPSTIQEFDDWFARTADPYGRLGKQDS